MNDFTLGDLSPRDFTVAGDLLLLRSGGQDYKLQVGDLLANPQGASQVGVSAYLDLGETIEDALGQLKEEAAAADGGISSLQTRMAAAEGRVTTLQTQMGTADANVSTLQSEMSAVQDTVSGLADDIAANGLAIYSLKSPVSLDATETGVQRALNAYTGYGNLRLPQNAFVDGARLTVVIPLQYHLSGYNALTISLVFEDVDGTNGGDATLFTHTFDQEQDIDVLRIDLAARAAHGYATAYAGYAKWDSNLDPFTDVIPVSDYDLVEFTGNFSVNVTAQFALESPYDGVIFQDVQLQYVPPPVDLYAKFNP